MNETIEVIDKFGFPIAAAVVLFWILVKVMQSMQRQWQETQAKYIEHLEKTSAEQMNVIKENTRAMLRLADVLLEFSRKFNLEKNEGK
ncbi:MAG: hypothetical protein KBS70_07005 [Bacteroidales bacterium]|nr:hypothetical protein [Candidatus Colicola equi]